jgi:hypothetical protein
LAGLPGTHQTVRHRETEDRRVPEDENDAFGGLSRCEKRVFLKSPVRKIRTPGSVRGLLGNWQSYRNGFALGVRSNLYRESYENPKAGKACGQKVLKTKQPKTILRQRRTFSKGR